MALGNFLFGSPQKINRIPLYNPQQQAASSQLLSQGLQGLQNLGTGTFEPIAQQARTQFAQRTVPSIAERFTGMGGQGSSAFGQQLGAAGAGLEESLAAMGQQFNQQERGQLMSLLGLGMQPTEHTFMTPQQPGFLLNLLQQLLSGSGQMGSQGGMQGGSGNLMKLLSLLM